tara:strand:+ start:505 stop:1491 length:987 start_codon:yes stop_codon:yes gene_type:complete
MKLIYFSFKHRHRQKELNNFLKSRFYGNFLLLNLGGPFRYFFSKILTLLKIGKGISCDGKPLIKEKSSGINFWMRGTHLNIPKEMRSLNNNYVTIANPVLKNNDQVFRIYPLNIIKAKIRTNTKLIYASKTINKSNKNKFVWENFKNQIINDFTLIDDINFWKNNFSENSDEHNFSLYTDLKTYLRHEIILYLKKKYTDKMILIGDDWKEYFDDAKSSIFNVNKLKNIYNGNICLDLGSTLGSVSLYSRSNQIIESGGLILQIKQNDADEIWKKISNKITFTNNNNLIKLIDNMLINNAYCEVLLSDIYNNFKDSKNNMENNLNKIFN